MSALDEVRHLAEAVARRHSVRLWDVAIEGGTRASVVRIYVDAEGGVDLDTVARVSEEVSRGLDLSDPIPGSYTLEVSSPGLERNLRSPEHFVRSVGSKVVLRTKERVIGNSHRIEGALVAASEGAVRIRTATDEFDVAYDDIKTARTVFEWN